MSHGHPSSSTVRRSRLPQLLPRARTLLPRSPASSMAELQPQPCPQRKPARIWRRVASQTRASAVSRQVHLRHLRQARSKRGRSHHAQVQRRKRRPHQPPRGPQGMPSTQELERGRESLKRRLSPFWVLEAAKPHATPRHSAPSRQSRNSPPPSWAHPSALLRPRPLALSGAG